MSNITLDAAFARHAGHEVLLVWGSRRQLSAQQVERVKELLGRGFAQLGFRECPPASLDARLVETPKNWLFAAKAPAGGDGLVPEIVRCLADECVKEALRDALGKGNTLAPSRCQDRLGSVQIAQLSPN
jgi:hypothetical protein